MLKQVMIGPKAYISIDKLKSNLNIIKKKVGPLDILCVIKANGYGHGAIAVAKAVSNFSNIHFGVFSISEALELRQASITNDIMIFSKMQFDIIDDAFNNNIILNLSSFDDIEYLKTYISETKNKPRYHIKFDTGMTRLGVDIDKADLFYEKLVNDIKVHPEGIYTHFATADEGELEYANNQLSKFKDVISLADKYNIKFKYIHCTNSGAILNLQESYFNMIRVGMLLYGALPSNEVPKNIKLKPVMSYCGSIVNIRRVPKDTNVSYGGVYQTKNDTNIGVIQTGFADGFPRPWFKNGYICYKGQQYKIAGRICMDQLMVDFGETNPRLGDDVLFFGEDSNGNIPIENIAEAISSTVYVLLTSIGGRTKYIYK